MTARHKHSRRRRILPAALGCALAAGVAAAEPEPQQNADTPVGFHCIVMPHAVIDVSSGTAGRLDAVHVERGNSVVRHQLVAELESGVERAQVALAGTRAAIDTEIRLRRAEQRVDARNASRIATLHASRAVSAQQQDAAARDASVADLRVREAREKQRLAGLELARAEEVLKLRAVRSPISGVVVDRFKWPGEFVEDEPIVRVAQLDPLRVEVILPVAEHRKLRVGQQVEVYPETEADAPRLATLKVVDPMADPASGTFRATLELPNPGNALLAGIKCRARLVDASAPTATAGSRAAAPPADGVRDSAPASESAPATGPKTDRPRAQPYSPRVPGSAAPRAPLQSAELPAPPSVPVAAVTQTAPGGSEQHGEGARGSASAVDSKPLQSTAAAPAARGAPARSCGELGPMDSAAAATQLAQELSTAGFRTSVSERVLREANGFIVLAVRSADPRDTIKQLKARGVRDLILMRSGEYAGRVALGIYKGPRQAERRRAAIEKRGLGAEVLERTRARSEWRVAVHANEALHDPAALGAALATLAPRHPALDLTCPTRLSAAL